MAGAPDWSFTWHGDAVRDASAEAQRLGLEATAASMVAPAMAETPVLTGTAQGSIGFRPAERRGNRWVVLFGSFDVAYFIWLEIGARGRPGGHMLQRALDAKWSELGDNIRKFMKLGR